jgi:hypothetical protein
MHSSIPIYGKRVAIVTNDSGRGRYAKFCAHKIEVVERNVCNSIN